MKLVKPRSRTVDDSAMYMRFESDEEIAFKLQWCDDNVSKWDKMAELILCRSGAQQIERVKEKLIKYRNEAKLN